MTRRRSRDLTTCSYPAAMWAGVERGHQLFHWRERKKLRRWVARQIEAEDSFDHQVAVESRAVGGAVGGERRN